MSDNDSSSSEDLPLSALANRHKQESSDEAEFDDEDDESGGEEADESDDFIVEEEDDDGDEDGDYDSDSSDDAPISSLKSKKKSPPKKAKAKPAKKTTSAKKKAAPKKKATSAKKKKPAKKSAKAKAAASSSTSNHMSASSEMYSQCDKGKLVQSLLARWWYAYEWPDPKCLEESTPKGYDALDGFPGVYICAEGGDVGKFIDKRDHSQSPSFNNFAKKDSEELKEMLLTAIEKQMKVLIGHEGEGTDTERSLKVLQKWTQKLNCPKADKQAEKVLKAKKLKLS